MSEEDYDLFCTHCGQRISKDTVFCPSCGMQVSGESEAPVNNNNYRNNNYGNNYYYPDRSGRLLFLSIIFVLSALYFLYEGITSYVNADAIMDQLINSPSWPDLCKLMMDAGGYTEQQVIDLIKSSMIMAGLAFIVAGASMGIAAICGFTKKVYVLGLICCIVATICTSITVLGLFFGLLMTFLYASTKHCFNS